MRASRRVLNSTLSWSTRFLAVAAALVLGRTSQAGAAPAASLDAAYASVDQAAGTEVSYVQVEIAGDDGNPDPPKYE
ncbi:MAG: hypothetical protein AB1505_33745 [Candidatus Latescibacterota bacterium]